MTVPLDVLGHPGGSMGHVTLTWANAALVALRGLSLVGFRAGHEVRLDLGDRFEVTIETLFHVSGAERVWSGEPLMAKLAGVLVPLRSVRVTGAEVDDDATLHLVFGATELAVPSHPDFEAWQVRGPGGLLIVCVPGGDMATWAAD